MKMKENETQESFEERKRQRIVKIMVGGMCITLSLGMIAYTVGMILNYNKSDFKRFEPIKKIEEQTKDESKLLKKTL